MDVLHRDGRNLTYITDMADAAIDGLILCFKVPLGMNTASESCTGSILYQLVETGEQAKEETCDLINTVILIIITT